MKPFISVWLKIEEQNASQGKKLRFLKTRKDFLGNKGDSYFFFINMFCLKVCSKIYGCSGDSFHFLLLKTFFKIKCAIFSQDLEKFKVTQRPQDDFIYRILFIELDK